MEENIFDKIRTIENSKENIPNTEFSNSSKNIWAILMLGALSMLFAEVSAGSSKLWFLELFGWLSTFTLYLTHVLFYFNIAVRTGKFSFWHLYMWGMLFALYEAPITQVLWAGYMDGSLSAFGLVGGIAIFEFVTLVFFWHPIMSFIVPILFYEVIVLEKGGKIIPEHFPLLKKLKGKKKWVFLWFFIISSDQAASAGGNMIVAFGAYLGSILFVLIFQKLAKKKTFGVDTLILSKRGLKILIFILIVWVYGIISYFISLTLPGRFPTTLMPYISLIIIIGVILLLIKKSPKITRKSNSSNNTKGVDASIDNLGDIPQLVEEFKPEYANEENRDSLFEEVFSYKDLKKVFLLQLIGVLLFSISGAIAMMVFVINVTLFPIIGLILLFKLIKTLIKLG